MHACEHDLRQYAASECPPSSVIFAGETDNVDEYLRASDVFVFPTENEAFGVSLVEAMACGLPSVATRVGGISDFVAAGKNGLLVDAGNFAQLRQGLERLLAGGDDICALGAAARQTAVTRFAVDAVVKDYLRVFESLLDRRSQAPAS